MFVNVRARGPASVLTFYFFGVRVGVGRGVVLQFVNFNDVFGEETAKSQSKLDNSPKLKPFIAFPEPGGFSFGG